jgi:hypothetical protein
MILNEDKPIVQQLNAAFNNVRNAKTLQDFYNSTIEMKKADDFHKEHIRDKNPNIDTSLANTFATEYTTMKDVVEKKWLTNTEVDEKYKNFWISFFKNHGDFEKDVIDPQRKNIHDELADKLISYFQLGQKYGTLFKGKNIESIKDLKKDKKATTRFFGGVRGGLIGHHHDQDDISDPYTVGSIVGKKMDDNNDDSSAFIDSYKDNRFLTYFTNGFSFGAEHGSVKINPDQILQPGWNELSEKNIAQNNLNESFELQRAWDKISKDL